MHHRFPRVLAVMFAIFAVMPLRADVSRQQADAFAKKVAQIRQQGSAAVPNGTRRTPVTQDELNSWFAFRAPQVLPTGVSKPQLSILGGGRVAGEATVDLDAIAKRRSSGGTFDPFSYLGGRVPVTVSGVLHTEEGKGRFELQEAEVSGVPVPKMVLQELVSRYSRSATNPDGIDIDQTFPLPAGIDKIEVGQGQAVVVQ